MVQTISHRFNTHDKRLSLSASVVIIIITRLHATSRINHTIFQSFTVIQFYHQSIPKLMSHYQLSNFAIYGLEHSETDINS